MLTTTKRHIKYFYEEGEAIDGEAVLRTRHQVEDHIREEMRGKGYVPVLDILPQLYWEFSEESETFKFVIIIYGTFVGKVKAKRIMCLLDGHPLYFQENE